MSRRVLLVLLVVVVAVAVAFVTCHAPDREVEHRPPVAASSAPAPRTDVRPRERAADQPPPEGTAPEPGTRELLVVDDLGKPVAGAEVRVGEKSLSTDAAGRLRVSIGTEAVVSAPGRVTTTVEVAEEESANRAQRIVLREARRIAGVVVDGDGRPIESVAVELEDVTVLSGTKRKTGSDGTFSFDGIDSREAHEGTLDASREGWTRARTNVVPGDIGVRIVLRHWGRIRGTVVLEDGSPAFDAVVMGTSTTDKMGRFEIQDAAPGPFRVEARKSTSANSKMRLEGSATCVVPEGGVVSDVRVVLAPPTSHSFVAVQVVDPEGKPSKAAVYAYADGVELVHAWTKDSGAILLPIDEPPGTSVTLAASGQSGSVRALEPVATRSTPPLTTVTLTLGPPGRLRLHLVAPDGSEISVDPSVVRPTLSPVALAEDGTYPLGATDQFMATIEAPGFATRAVLFTPPHPLLREETVHLVLAAHVCGRVLLPDGSAAPTTMNVVVSVPTGSLTAMEAGDAGLDEEGRFDLPTLPPGSAVLRVFAVNDVVLVRRFDVAAGATLDLGDLRIGETGGLRGLATDGEGRGVAGAHVVFLDPGHEVCPPVCTRPDGTFDVSLPQGLPLLLRVRARGFATTFVDASSGDASPVRIVMQAAGSVRVDTTAVRDLGVRSVTARIPGTPREWEPHLAPGSLAEGPECDGVYDDLPPGGVDLVLELPHREIVRRVDVTAGKLIDCVFQ